MTDNLEKYSDIIAMTKFRDPNYPEIQFDKYLERIMPGQNKFITDFDSNKIKNYISKTFGNETTYFQTNGELVEVTFQNLYYYQKTVGINGPKNNDINEPVFVLNIDDMEILFNGYHRTFLHLLNGKKMTKAYRLSLDKNHCT
jgi:hypothetical protein